MAEFLTGHISLHKPRNMRVGPGAWFTGTSAASVGNRSVLEIKANSKPVMIHWMEFYAGSEPATYVTGATIETAFRNHSNAIYARAITTQTSELAGLNYVPGFQQTTSGLGTLVVDYQAFTGTRGNTDFGSFLGTTATPTLSATTPRDTFNAVAATGHLIIPTGNAWAFATKTTNQAITFQVFGSEVDDDFGTRD